MFSFLKKCIQIEEPKSVRERAIRTFSRIEGLDDIKEMLLRALESQERAHTPANRSSCLCQIIIYVRNREDNAAQNSLRRRSINYKSRIAEIHRENRHKEIIIIDEIDKMPIKDQEGLLTMMEHGNFTNTKVRNTKTVKANMVIFATSNSTERLSKPLLSRFTVLEIPKYTYPEFEYISTRIVNKLPRSTVIQIASVWKVGSRDIRDVLKIAKLCNHSDTEEDVSRLICIHQRYYKTGREYN